MVAGLDGDSQLEQALAGGAPQRAGWFRLHFDGEQWEWSPEVERLPVDTATATVGAGGAGALGGVGTKCWVHC